MNLLENRSVVEIDSDYGKIGLGRSRFFLDTYDVIPANLGNAKSLRVGNFLQENLRSASLLPERIDSSANIHLDDVVSQHHAHWIAVRKILRQSKRLRDSPFSFLVCIIQML